MYENGEGTEKDLEKAIYWYDKAAKNGNISAQNNLGYQYMKGEVPKKDSTKAVYWLQKAAESGNKIAYDNLAICYRYR